jgi:hypothetical protein
METGRRRREGPPSVAPKVVTCRYCRNVQGSGLFCDRLRDAAAVGTRSSPSAASAAGAKDASELRSCKRCGERSPLSMERCGACGALLDSTP